MKHCRFLAAMWLWLASSSEATKRTSVVLSAPESLKLIGQQAWERLTTRTMLEGKPGTPSCWDVALGRFRETSIECKTSSEGVKSLLSLTLTKCHFVSRHGGFPSEQHCDMNQAFEIAKTMSSRHADDNGAAVQLDSLVKLCLSHLSESAFHTYIEFFNHLDNICFFFHSQLWQEKTDDTVNRLSDVSADVADKLTHVHRQHSLLLEQQQVALQRQQHLLSGSKRLELALASGHSKLQSVFSAMREEVQQEQQRIVGIFDDSFKLISKILQLQQNIVGSLANFESVMTYAGLVILTFYLTCADSTRSCRASLYALWTLMLSAELALGRVAPHLARLGIHVEGRWLARYWRMAIILIGTFRWFYAWWSHKDAVEVIVDALQDGLKEIKAQLQSSLPASAETGKIRGRRFSCLVPALSQRDLFDDGRSDSEFSLPDDAECSVSDSDDSIVSGDISVVNGAVVHYPPSDTEVSRSTAVPLGSHRRSVSSDRWTGFSRGVLHRRCRPLVNRVPIPGVAEDIKYLRLNPILLFESDKEFMVNYNAFIKQDRLRREAAEKSREDPVSPNSPTGNLTVVGSKPSGATGEACVRSNKQDSLDSTRSPTTAPSTSSTASLPEKVVAATPDRQLRPRRGRLEAQTPLVSEAQVKSTRGRPKRVQPETDLKLSAKATPKRKPRATTREKSRSATEKTSRETSSRKGRPPRKPSERQVKQE